MSEACIELRSDLPLQRQSSAPAWHVRCLFAIAANQRRRVDARQISVEESSDADFVWRWLVWLTQKGYGSWCGIVCGLMKPVW